nr:PrsW family glutamic-type intramembrane protease [Romeria gracilis]
MDQPHHILSETQELILGREPECQIIFDSRLYDRVSRRHAAVRPSQKTDKNNQAYPTWQICDLNSANGTFINGQRVQNCQTLQVGDRITLGGQNGPELVFECQTYNQKLPGKSAAGFNRLDSARPETALTWNHLVLVVSTRRDLVQKAYLIPGIITVIFVVFLFVAADSPALFNLLLAAYLGGAGFFFIYQLCGKRKPWWILMGSAIATMAILYYGPTLSLFIYIFRVVLPGNTERVEQAGFISQFVAHFFGAGLMEELLKALPALGLCWIGRSLSWHWRDRVGVVEPLDGILLAAAAALGFTWLETLGQFVPAVAQQVAAMSGTGAGQLAGLQLLIPRVLGSVAGHMAYSGYFGYFIGLSVLKPSKRWRILGIGYLTAATVHALWNATASTLGPLGPLGLAFVGVIAYAFLVAAILKARELSPSRSQNFAARI